MQLWKKQTLSSGLTERIREVSTDLMVAVGEEVPVGSHLVYDSTGLSYVDSELGSLHLDFVNDRVNYGRKNHRGKSELIAKAVGLSKGISEVFDATLGLGQDAWFLMNLGAQVSGCERSPVLYLLLSDAIDRARTVFPEMALRVFYGDSMELLRQRQFSVVYLDPMFPEKKKSALPRKEMQIFRKLVGDDSDAKDLLDAALASAGERVVVKRPLRAPPIGSPVTHEFVGTTVRYDLYSVRGMPR